MERHEPKVGRMRKPPVKTAAFSQRRNVKKLYLLRLYPSLFIGSNRNLLLFLSAASLGHITILGGDYDHSS